MNQTSDSGENILFLYLPTGSGHLSPCKAIKEEIDSKKLEDINTFMYAPSETWVQKFVFEIGYKFVSSDYPLLWAIIYEVSRLRFMMHFEHFMLKVFCQDMIYNYIEENNITKVVSSHFMMNKTIGKYAKKNNPNLKHFTIITDPYSVPILWSYKQSSKCIVFSDLAKSMMKRQIWKLSKRKYEDIYTFNPIISKKFKEKSQPRDELAKKRQIDISKLTVLFVGGAEGFPKAKGYLAEIAKLECNLNILFVAGRNKKQYNFAKKLQENSKHVTFYVYEYIDFMFDLINISDLSIVKSGASVVFENIALKKPMIISTYLHNQEIGTKNFVVSNKFGFYIKGKRKLAKKLAKIEQNRSILEEIKINLNNYNFKIGTEEVADFILK